jgi:two-component system sensor histidine kinase YcbA
MSTGIGLTHVKHIVERSLDGEIEVDSSINNMTRFVVKIPKRTLCQGGKNE